MDAFAKWSVEYEQYSTWTAPSGRVFRVPTWIRAAASSAAAATAAASSLRGSADGEQFSGAASDDAAADVRFDDRTGSYVWSTVVPRAVLGSVIGAGGKNIRELEATTKCRVRTFDKRGRGGPAARGESAASGSSLLPGVGRGTVEVTGSAVEHVVSAKTRVLLTVAGALARAPFTHFVCLPLNSEPWMSRAAEAQSHFRALLGPATGFHESMFMDPRRLHMTIAVLRIYDQRSLELVRTALQEALPRVYDALGTRTLLLPLSGVFSMNSEANAANVLYTAPQSGSPADKQVHTVAEIVLDSLQKRVQLDRDQMRAFLPHVTLLNTKYFRGDAGSASGAPDGQPPGAAAAAAAAPTGAPAGGPGNGGTGGRGQRRVFRRTIDASEVLSSSVAGMDLGSARVASLCLCALRPGDPESGSDAVDDGSPSAADAEAAEGFYTVLQRLPLP